MEYNSAGTIKAKYTHGLGIDEPLAVQQNTTKYYYHADGLGSITAITNSSGSKVQTYKYDSFGNMTKTGTIVQPFTYTAREYDTETGLYFYRARYYDAKVGRFITKDPISFAGGDINLYAYVWNNPANSIDPYGLYVWVNPYTYWRNFFGGTGDLYRNYQNMRDANTIGADKYFHCMGHCEASRRGIGGRDASELIGEGRELFDEHVKGDSRSECDADRRANKQGRDGDPNKPCKDVCSSLRPSGLDPWY
jgi:RHS repeat-associated protein